MSKTFVAYVIGLPSMGYTQDEMKRLIEQSDFCISVHEANADANPLPVGHILTLADYALPDLPKGSRIQILATACRGKIVSVMKV
jgi:hypothetical protein